MGPAFLCSDTGNALSEYSKKIPPTSDICPYNTEKSSGSSRITKKNTITIVENHNGL